MYSPIPLWENSYDMIPKLGKHDYHSHVLLYLQYTVQGHTNHLLGTSALERKEDNEWMNWQHPYAVTLARVLY